METSLHRQLKQHYSSATSQVEVRVGRYRIDVLDGDQCVEIQHASLAALRVKVGVLLKSHSVLIVKPIVLRRTLVQRARRNGRVLYRRLSPKRGSVLDLFDELVYFTRLFPHPRLTVEMPLVEIEEWRFPGHGRRRWRHQRDFQVEDQKLMHIHGVHRLATIEDLQDLIPATLPQPFHTGMLSKELGVPRKRAQRIAYCLRHMGGVETVGKQGNAWLYEMPARNQALARVLDSRSPRLKMSRSKGEKSS